MKVLVAELVDRVATKLTFKTGGLTAVMDEDERTTGVPVGTVVLLSEVTKGKFAFWRPAGKETCELVKTVNALHNEAHTIAGRLLEIEKERASLENRRRNLLGVYGPGEIATAKAAAEQSVYPVFETRFGWGDRRIDTRVVGVTETRVDLQEDGVKVRRYRRSDGMPLGSRRSWNKPVDIAKAVAIWEAWLKGEESK